MGLHYFLVPSLLLLTAATFFQTSSAAGDYSKCAPSVTKPKIKACERTYGTGGDLAGVESPWQAVRVMAAMCGKSGLTRQQFIDNADCMQEVWRPCKGEVNHHTVNRGAWYDAVCDHSHNATCIQEVFQKENVIRWCEMQDYYKAMKDVDRKNKFCQNRYETNKCIVKKLSKCGQKTTEVFQQNIKYAVMEECENRFDTTLVVG